MNSLESTTPWLWRERRGDVEIVFSGRGLAGERNEVLHGIDAEAPGVAWAKQVHSATVLAANEPGLQGEGDALVTDRNGLTLCVITADCVPVLLSGPPGITGLAAVHAGWRGIAGRIIPATLAGLTGPLSEWTAWVGPAIGACCYEVGPEVAEQVAGASDAAVVQAGPAGKPHLDLHEAVRRQLAAAGVGEVVCVPGCTRCDEERLWSYRREGRNAGRNHAFIWKTESKPT